jgi:guanidinobutyrase
MLRPCNMATRAAPFGNLQVLAAGSLDGHSTLSRESKVVSGLDKVADVGDVPINTYNLLKSVGIIESFLQDVVLAHGAVPFSIGGDHVVTLPILRALAKKHGKGRIGVVQVDAHAGGPG